MLVAQMLNYVNAMLDDIGLSANTLFILLHFVIVTLTLLRVLLRPHREPAARIAWIAVIATLPIVGVLAYLLFGEVNIVYRQKINIKAVFENNLLLDSSAAVVEPHKVEIPLNFEQVFKLGQSINGFSPVGGNKAVLMADSNAMITALVADIESAQHRVHLLFYIWLLDNNGCKVIAALQRAAARGLECRVIVDSLGSSVLIRSQHWLAMKNAGISLALALPVGNPLLKVFSGRIDLRNHRKIVVIDGATTYCGSQNCADPEFLPEAKFGPWVDVMLRVEGPVAQQNQQLFDSDWLAWAAEDTGASPDVPAPGFELGFTAQVFGTGPGNRPLAMSQMIVALITCARQELIIGTPYFIPNEAIHSALQAAAWRGVKTTLILPARNNSRIVQRASRSYYQELLAAGVVIYEYTEGLLHAKTLSVDRKFAMLGSANLDRRSFDLNYENNMLIFDDAVVAALVARQEEYVGQAELITHEFVSAWSLPSRLVNNTLAVLSPIL